MDIQQISSTPSGNYTQVPAADAPSVVERQVASPVDTVAAIRPAPPVPDLEQVSQAVQKINKNLQAQGQGLEFSIDQDSNRTVVKVIDQQTKEVLRQMPTVEALEIAKALDSAKGMLIRQQA